MIPSRPSEADVVTAGKIVKACKQIDPWFAKTTADLARGWATLFAPHGFTEEELLGGVLEFYAHAKAGEHAMPGQILAGARKTREQIATDPNRRAEVEARREARREAQDQAIAATQGKQLTPAKAHEPAKNRDVNTLIGGVGRAFPHA